MNNLALVPGATSISVLGGAAANTYYSVGGAAASYVSSGPSATLTGNNFLDLPTTINGTNSGNWYMIGGPGADVFLGNSSANTFIGNSGADTFTSGGGADSIDGGLGAAVFAWRGQAQPCQGSLKAKKGCPRAAFHGLARQHYLLPGTLPSTPLT